MAEHIIDVSVVPHGVNKHVDVTPASERFKKDDTVKWHSAGKKFTIKFVNTSPFRTCQFASKDIGGGTHEVAEAVQKRCFPHTNPYILAIEDGEGGDILISGELSACYEC